MSGTPVFSSFDDLFAPLETLIGCQISTTKSHSRGLNCCNSEWPLEDRAAAPCSSTLSFSSSSSSAAGAAGLPTEWSPGLTRFRNYWGHVEPSGGCKYVMNPSKIQELRTWLTENIMIRRTMKDVKNALPTNVRVVKTVSLEERWVFQKFFFFFLLVHLYPIKYFQF